MVIYLSGFCVLRWLRVVYVGGNLNNGANDGLVYWNCHYVVGNAVWYVAARLSYTA